VVAKRYLRALDWGHGSRGGIILGRCFAPKPGHCDFVRHRRRARSLHRGRRASATVKPLLVSSTLLEFPRSLSLLLLTLLAPFGKSTACRAQ
jgi:hypothetical protein